MTRCPTPCDADCEIVCHEKHDVRGDAEIWNRREPAVREGVLPVVKEPISTDTLVHICLVVLFVIIVGGVIAIAAVTALS